MPEKISRKRIRKTSQYLKTGSNQEQGIALVMALLMGTVLIGGATALMVRMIGARKLSSSESYQQLAEAAAVNGFNRILASMNASSRQSYLGYLYLISNEQSNNGTYTWDNLPSISEPCAPKLSVAPDWHTADIDLQGNGETLRDDIAGKITTHFRLRRYVGPQQGSSARFEVEGIVKREGSQQDFEARSLLNRSLLINSQVPTEHDWAVLAARNYDLSGLTLKTNTASNINVAKGGMIIKLLGSNSGFDTTNPDACNASNLLALVGAYSGTEIANNIWPVKNIINNDWDIPTPEYFNKDNTSDTYPNSSAQRVWSFDDSIKNDIDPDNQGISCNEVFSPICTRPASSDPNSQHTNPIKTDQIRVIPTVVRKCINRIDWSSTSGLSGEKGTVFSNDERCDSSQTQWKNRVKWRDVRASEYEILLRDRDLCINETNEPKGNVCHVYIEHMNLSRSKIYIENSTKRPIVLHLETPSGAERRNDLVGRYELKETSLLCGINPFSEDASGRANAKEAPTSGIIDCNRKAELLILASSEGNPATECKNNTKEGTLHIGANVLPAAIINMPNGNIELNTSSTLTKAVIWANSICTGSNQSLTLDTTTSDNQTSIISQAEQQWDWLEKRYGRTIVRGIRGTGFDTFSRW